MRNKILASLAVFALMGFGINMFTKDTSCVNVYVDYGSLDNNTKVEQCVDSTEGISALDLLDKAKYKIEGTQKYGDAVVCRVNNLPNKSMESCQNMPPENAFWAVIIKKKQFLPFPRNEWGWAETGINEIYLNPGDSLGLVFSTDGDLQWP